MNAVTVHVPLGDDSYDIHISANALQRVPEDFTARPGQRGVLITAENLVDQYAAEFQMAMQNSGWGLKLLAVPDGEASKNLRLAGQLCRSMAQDGCDRGSVVFALGGGVVGDLAGFVASIYMRGIDFVQLPTTLLAQADASVGGKVAVDIPEGKNLIGCFHQPAAVYIDTSTLTTLPDRHIQAGMAEVIKHAVIADEGLFEFISDNIDNIFECDPKTLQHLLQRNCQIKVNVVCRDPLDTGVRGVLNLGHTIGHALEAATPDWALHHGEAVAAGMIAEAHLSQKMGLCEPKTVKRIERLLDRVGLIVNLDDVDRTKATETIERDKKITGGKLALPLIRDIGDVQIVETVSIEDVTNQMLEGLGRR